MNVAWSSTRVLLVNDSKLLPSDGKALPRTSVLSSTKLGMPVRLLAHLPLGAETDVGSRATAPHAISCAAHIYVKSLSMGGIQAQSSDFTPAKTAMPHPGDGDIRD